MKKSTPSVDDERNLDRSDLLQHIAKAAFKRMIVKRQGAAARQEVDAWLVAQIRKKRDKT